MQEHAQTLTERNDFSGFTNPYLKSWNKIKKTTIFNENEENDYLKKDDYVTFRTGNYLKQKNNVKMIIFFNFFFYFLKIR